MVKRFDRKRRLLLWVTLLVVMGGGAVHFNLSTITCTFSHHHHESSHQTSHPVCCVVLPGSWLFFLSIYSLHSLLIQKAASRIQRGFTVLLFRPPRLGYR